MYPKIKLIAEGKDNEIEIAKERLVPFDTAAAHISDRNGDQRISVRCYGKLKGLALVCDTTGCIPMLVIDSVGATCLIFVKD